ncbi:TetR/AcrR family transcriptional regulator [Devriesea agamarum]|uniref:TetR/AcrR family transcriptional regulator n=1 Tax=Devriesea agamarum TaxID=472569 RepID=UPI00071C64F6|nr:TetR/AcrR family transcriptional regulator [Devriesea agamarum]
MGQAELTGVAPQNTEDSGKGFGPRRQRTRARLLDAARTLFAERGVAGVSVEQLCDAAGFTRGAFYSNFRDMDDLVAALLAQHHEIFGKELHAAIAASSDAAGVQTEPGPVRDRVQAIVRDIVETLPSRRTFYLVRQELELHAMRSPEAAATWRAARAEFRQLIGEGILRGLKDCGLRLLIDIDDLVDIVHGLADQHMREALLDGRDTRSFAKLCEVLTEVILSVTEPLNG